MGAKLSMNHALCEFAMRWSLDGDYLRCADCGRPQIASRAGERFRHGPDCRSTDTHPWREFMRILAPLCPTPAPEPTEGDDAK